MEFVSSHVYHLLKFIRSQVPCRPQEGGRVRQQVPSAVNRCKTLRSRARPRHAQVLALVVALGVAIGAAIARRCLLFVCFWCYYRCYPGCCSRGCTCTTPRAGSCRHRSPRSVILTPCPRPLHLVLDNQIHLDHANIRNAGGHQPARVFGDNEPRRPGLDVTNPTARL